MERWAPRDVLLCMHTDGWESLAYSNGVGTSMKVRMYG